MNGDVNTQIINMLLKYYQTVIKVQNKGGTSIVFILGYILSIVISFTVFKIINHINLNKNVIIIMK